MTNRQFLESPVTQGEDESINYYFSSTPWGTSPTAITVIVWDVTDAESTADWDNVTSTVMPVNSPSVVGDVITLSPLKLLTDGHVYRIDVLFTANGNNFNPYGFVIGGE